MMLLLKLARADAVGSTDTYVDMAGYAACAGEIWHKNEQMRKTVSAAWEDIKKENFVNPVLDAANQAWANENTATPKTAIEAMFDLQNSMVEFVEEKE